MRDRVPSFISQAWDGLANPRWAIPVWLLLFAGFWALAWTALEPLGVERETIEVAWPLAYSVLTALLASSALAVLATLRFLNDSRQEVAEQVPATFFQKSFASAEDEELIRLLKDKLESGKTITLVALALAVLDRETLVQTLIRRASEGANVVVCAGNPFSPPVISRWIEESQFEAPRGQAALEERIRRYLDYLKGAGDPPNFRLVLFDAYPTLATYIIDDEIFVFPYSYEVRGNFSPMLHFHDDDSPQARFFKEAAERLVSQSTPAGDVMRAKYQSQGFLRETWKGLGVFILPEEGGAFEEFGRQALGYDARTGHTFPPTSDASRILQRYAGPAHRLGFHLTMVDRLLFPARDQSAMNLSRQFASAGRRAIAEAKYVASLCPEFTLVNFSLDDRFRGNQLVLRCQDPSGSLELLHSELTTRVNPLALSSSYRAGLANNPLPENAPRAARMIQRYGAPYVLEAFEPHFTLCPNLPTNAGERARVVRAAERLISDLKLPGKLEVCDLAIVTGKLDGMWVATSDSVVPLGRSFPREV